MFSWVHNFNSEEAERAREHQVASVLHGCFPTWRGSTALGKSTGTVTEHILYNLPCGISCKASDGFICGSLLTTK